MDKKQFMRLAFAGLLVGRVVPAFSGPSVIAPDVDATLQKAQTEQQLTLEDIDALGDSGADDPVGLY